MNKEDYDDLESYLIMQQTGKIGKYAPRGKYWKEINWIAKKLDISVRRIGILEDTVDGDEWVMIDGDWRGDLVEWEQEMKGTFNLSESYYERLKKSIEITKEKK